MFAGRSGWHNGDNEIAQTQIEIDSQRTDSRISPVDIGSHHSVSVKLGAAAYNAVTPTV